MAWEGKTEQNHSHGDREEVAVSGVVIVRSRSASRGREMGTLQRGYLHLGPGGVREPLERFGCHDTGARALGRWKHLPVG